MLKSIELELTKARELAEQMGHSVLCYLIEMAILEARSAASEISQEDEILQTDTTFVLRRVGSRGLTCITNLLYRSLGDSASRPA